MAWRSRRSPKPSARRTLVVCFIRQVNLSYKYEGEQKLTIDTDPAALRTFSRFLEAGHAAEVPVLPVYDTGTDAAELIAENAAIYGCDRVLIGTSRQGALYHLIKGHFQRRLEALLPPEIPVHGDQPANVSSISTSSAYMTMAGRYSRAPRVEDLRAYPA